MRTSLHGKRAVSYTTFKYSMPGAQLHDQTERVQLKRVPVLPRESRTVSTEGNAPQTIVPVPYETTI